jgi:hypothetical protein
MWKRLRDALSFLWQESQKSPGEHRAAKERARFWAEARDGQREAEAHHDSNPKTP